jgi:hypothetical protein
VKRGLRLIRVKVVEFHGTLFLVASWFLPDPKDIAMPIRFGATDTPVCPQCSALMRLTRRTPHPELGYQLELQTFTCRACHHEMMRNADRMGEVSTSRITIPPSTRIEGSIPSAGASTTRSPMSSEKNDEQPLPLTNLD